MGQGASAEASPCQAASRGDVVAVEQWLRAGGDPNAVHKSLKGTALQAAARGDHVECLELLLRNGADINVATAEGTALHAAASRCCHRAVSLLLRWGANPAATNATGMTAAEVAENMGYANLARDIRQQASSSSSAQRAGSLEAAAVAKPAAGSRETAPPQQQQQRPGSPAAQTSLSRTSHESANGQVAGQPAPAVPAVAAGAAAPQAPPRPYAQQWPAAQPQPVAPSQARPQQWAAAQQPASQPQAHPQQWAGVQQPYASALQQQPQQPQQQPVAAGWLSFGQPGPGLQPAAQPTAAGWGAAAAGTPPPQAQRAERPLKWWQQPQNQPPPPVAHSHPAYQAWLQQQVAAQQAQQGYHTQQAQQAHGMYGAPAPYPAGYGSGYATQPAAPAGFAYQLNPATGGWVLVPAAAAQVPAAGAAPFYPSLQPGPSQRAQQVPAQQPAAAAPQHPAAAAAAPQPTPSSLAGGSTAARPAPAALPVAPIAGGTTAAAAAAKQQALQQAAPAAAPASTPAAGSAAAGAATAAGNAALAGSAASAPAELLLAEAAGDEHFEDINSGGSLMPSPSAPPATNSLLDRLFGQPEWQQPEGSAGEVGGSSGAAPTAGGGSSSGGDGDSGSGGASSTAAAAAAAAGKGTAGAAAPLAQPSEGGSPKGTIEAMVALGLADSGVTDDQEQQLQEGVAAATAASGASNAAGSSAAQDAAAAGRERSGGGAAAGGGSQGSTAAQSGSGSGAAGSNGSAAGTGAASVAEGSSQADRLVSQASSGSGERRVGVLRSNASCMVDISPWEVKWEELRKQGSIGEGAFGAVYKAVWHETQVAVKVVGELQRAQEAAGPEAQLLSSPILQNLRLECGLMASMRHPNVVQFLGVCACPPAIVTEYCSRGSLTHVLQEGLKSPQKAALLTWQRRLRMAMDAAKGMLYLHKRGIVHRDFKSPNLLVDASWVVKVADFNLSKVTEGAALNPSSTMGNVNPRWLAPEILEEHPATCQSDVYAFGITMWELITWQLPWGNAQIWTIMGQVMSGNRPPLPEPSAYSDLPGPGPFPCLPAWMALMQRCWHQDPGQRPDFAAIIAQLREIQALAAGSQGGGGTAQRQACTSQSSCKSAHQ